MRPCSRFGRAEEYQQSKESSSYTSYKRVTPNLNCMKDHGIEKFAGQRKGELDYSKRFWQVSMTEGREALATNQRLFLIWQFLKIHWIGQFGD